jgi:hypothetical protein
VGKLSLDELVDAKNKLFLCLQKQAYPEEYAALTKGNIIPKSSSITLLSPFIGEDGMLRIQGRLQQSDLTYEEKHPLIMPSHHLTKLLVRFQHVLLKHAGVDTLVSSIRCIYWIVGLRKLAKEVKRECVACQRQDAPPCNRPIAPLPSFRVKQASPFTILGLDYAGPLFSSDQPGKKLYILLFTCAVVRAIHLDCDFGQCENFP